MYPEATTDEGHGTWTAPVYRCDNVGDEACHEDLFDPTDAVEQHYTQGGDYFEAETKVRNLACPCVRP